VHKVVKDILMSTKARLDSKNSSGTSSSSDISSLDVTSKNEKKPEKIRDIVRSAKSIKSEGFTPIIAEIKPRILKRPLSSQEVVHFAELYQRMGACAISVLTQPTYFMGSIENARIAREASSLPILRKDFILDQCQLGEVKSDLVLLIAAFSKPLDQLVNAVQSMGMEPLVEVHTQEEMELAISTDVKIMGINNRNLKTLEVDLQTFERLGPIAKEAGLFVVAESGVECRDDVLRMEKAGADALLVGTSIMKDPHKLRELAGNLEI